MFTVKGKIVTHHPIAETVGKAVFNHMRLLEIYELPTIYVKDDKTGIVKQLTDVKREGVNIAWRRSQEITGYDF